MWSFLKFEYPLTTQANIFFPRNTWFTFLNLSFMKHIITSSKKTLNLHLLPIQGVLQVKINISGFGSLSNSNLKVLYSHMLCFALFCKKLKCKWCVVGAAYLSGPILPAFPPQFAYLSGTLSDIFLCIIYTNKASWETVSI